MECVPVKGHTCVRSSEGENVASRNTIRQSREHFRQGQIDNLYQETCSLTITGYRASNNQQLDKKE